jgi:hypothetical protein
MSGVDQLAAFTGLWNLDVVSNTALAEAEAA